MPSKDHRIAARHAKLRQRRKKQIKDPNSRSLELPSLGSTQESTTVVTRKAQITPRVEQFVTVPTVNQYVNREVKRILALAGSIMIILVVAGISLT